MAGSDILAETRHRTEDGHGLCVGYPFRDHKVRVIAPTTEALAHWRDAKELPRGHLGEIVIQGPGASPRYFRRPEATALAKIPDDGQTFWHRTGDMGYLDEQGRLWFCGRLAHVLTVQGKPYYPAMAEALYQSDGDVFRAGLVALRRHESHFLALCIEFHPGAQPLSEEQRRQRLEAVRERARSKGIPVEKVLVHTTGFPVDARHNAKIDYETLTRWAQEHLDKEAP
jgi:acyl-CoA synthetase (AMP-forming)/AMP-acid ligase II